jgi:hypothetical protein
MRRRKKVLLSADVLGARESAATLRDLEIKTNWPLTVLKLK